ncbi:hypothetical protein M9Y10_044777 [Tritrichomonas musculus]|uniref:AAA-ATPase-like domain-containing protein n=1 Tax=Tritrichomonas musculus TaxID=1915356 RepID=A0ABR2JV66_9EUKA
MNIEEPKCKSIRVPSSLREIADNDLFFFDKTHEVIKLANINLSQAFIARPRHFGKTMTADILYHLFSGNRDIFEKLNAKCLSEWDFSQKYTVLLLNLNINIISYDHFIQTLKNYLWSIANKYGIKIDLNANLPPTDILSEILNHLTEQRTKKIVVLVDDFDYCLFTKPSNTSFKPYVALLGSLVNIFKAYKDNIRLLLYFGVHYFTSNTIGNFFSVPPNISTDPELASVFGFTREEVLEQLPERLNYLLKLFQSSRIPNPLKESDDRLCDSTGDIVDYLFYYYGGFRFSPNSSVTVLNPFEVLNIFQNYRFSNYWLKGVINTNYLYTSPNILKNFCSIFDAFFNFDNFFIECLVPLIKGDMSISPSAVKKYRYVLDYGFLTFEMEKSNLEEPMLSIPNISHFEFLGNILIQKLSEKYVLQLKPIQYDKIDQGNILQIIDLLRIILIKPLSQEKNDEKSNKEDSSAAPEKDNLLSSFQTWEIKVFAALASLGIHISMKIPKSDHFYYAICETTRCSIHLFASTNCEPSVKQILPLLDRYGKTIPINQCKSLIFCVISCTTFTHSMRFDATWNNILKDDEWMQLNRRVQQCNHDFTNFDMSKFSNFETTIFRNNEDTISPPNNKKNMISFIDVIFQIFLELDNKTTGNKQNYYSPEQITRIVVRVFSNSQPFDKLLNQVKISIQYLYQTNKLKEITSGDRLLYGVKK